MNRVKTGNRSVFNYVFLLLSLLFVAPAHAEVFQCKGDDGVVRFQDRPCHGLEPTMPGSSTTTAVQNKSVGSGKHFFWQASAGKGTLYLLGSIHFGTSEMYPLPRVITNSFKLADTLVVEADVLNVDPVQMAQLVAGKAMYQDGSNLRQHLSQQTWQRLEQVAASLGLPIEMLSMQKPWFASMSLTALALNKLGFSEDKGIDVHFLSLARGKKQVVELEGMQWQLSLFDRLTAEEQVLMLEETLREIEHGKDFFDKMLRFWRAGDGDGIQGLFDEGMMAAEGGERLNKIIMTDRNRSMADTVHELAQKGGSYFVVVGAGHLPGAEGIVALLKQRGYQITQL